MGKNLVNGNDLLLNKELIKISNDFMKAYKDDVMLDINMLLDKNKLSNEFIWVVRDSGTHLYEKEKLFVLNDGSRDDYLYFKDYNVKLYQITITKRGRKNVYGTLKSLNRKQFTYEVENKGKAFNNVHFKVMMKDNRIYELDMNCINANIYSLSSELNIELDDIKKVYRQKYFN